jgi:hypothetical protein
MGCFAKAEISRENLTTMMAGDQDLRELERELEISTGSAQQRTAG